MANELKAVVTADIRQFVRSMSMVGSSASAASAVAVAAFAAVIATVVSLDKAGLKAAGTYEELGLALKFAIGDAKEANKEFAELVTFADQTPFDTAELIKYSIQLRNVTENAFGASDSIKNMAGALAVAQALGKSKTFVNSVAQIINAFQTGSGAISRYVRTLRNSSKFSAQAARQLKVLSKNGGSASQAIAILNKEFSKSRGNVKELSESSKGLESTLRSVAEITLAGLGSQGLDEYKLLLKAITEELREVRDIEAFDELGESLARLNGTLEKMVKGGSLSGILEIMTKIADAVNIVVSGLKIASEIGGLIWNPQNIAGYFEGIARGENRLKNDLPFTSNLLSDVPDIAQGLGIMGGVVEGAPTTQIPPLEPLPIPQDFGKMAGLLEEVANNTNLSRDPLSRPREQEEDFGTVVKLLQEVSENTESLRGDN